MAGTSPDHPGDLPQAEPMIELKNLEELGNLPIATTQDDLDQRVLAVLRFAKRHPESSISAIAEAIVEVLFFQSYAGRLQQPEERAILAWFDASFDPQDLPYLDALATLYANMASSEALEDLKRRIEDTKGQAREALEEALDELNHNCHRT